MNDQTARKQAEPKDRESPYCAFKDDRRRMWALVSRDVRLVRVVIVLAYGELTYGPVVKAAIGFAIR